MDRIEIPISKKKIRLTLLGALLFVLIGVFFTLTPETFISPLMKNPHVIRIAGILSVLFFGSVSFYGVKKLSDKHVGLVIDSNGIVDNTNATSVGFISWTDITAIETKQEASTKFLLIYTSNPENYIGRARGIKRKFMEASNKMYGTPLSIISNTLKCKFEDLEKLINSRFRQFEK